MRKLSLDEIPRPDTDELEALPRHPITVVLDNIRSIHNVGSMFRTSDAARVERLLLTGITGTPENRRLHKSALGAQQTVPWTYQDDPLAPIGRLRDEGYTIAALEITDTPMPIRQVSLDEFPICIFVGNELHGVSDEIIGQADLALEIPQFGRKHSLNVAVAYGIAVFELVRRYRSLAGLPARWQSAASSGNGTKRET